MAVRSETIQFLIISLVISLFAPIVLGIFYKLQNKDFPLRPLLIGMGVWFLVTQVFEKVFHFITLSILPLSHYPFLFALYAGLTAGVFEEGGRCFAFKKYLKNNRKWIDGVSFGIGHGGIEAWIIGVGGTLQTLYFASMINSNKVGDLLHLIPQSDLAPIVKTLVTNPPYLFMLGGIERVFALFIQVGLSILVLQSVRLRKIRYFIAAIFFHALFDFPAALVQTHVMNLWTAERIFLLLCIISIVYINKSQKIFQQDNTVTSGTFSSLFFR